MVHNYTESIVDGRPSSRVLAQPGGKSDMASILAMGGAPEPAKPAPRTANPVAPSMPGDAPVAGQRVAVRTEHGGITEVSSSRVLAAPGGKSDMASIIGGGSGADDRKAALMARRAQATAMHPTTNVNGM